MAKLGLTFVVLLMWLHVLFWIEAMNLLGLRGLYYPMLQTVLKWVSNVSDTLTEYFMMDLP
jgi:hypothetical protein